MRTRQWTQRANARESPWTFASIIPVRKKRPPKIQQIQTQMNPTHPCLQSCFSLSRILACLLPIGLLLSGSCRGAITFYDSHASWLSAASNTFYPSHHYFGTGPSAADSLTTLVIQDSVVTRSDPYLNVHNQGFITISHNYLSDGIATASSSSQTIVIGDEARNGITILAYLGSYAWNISFLHAFGMWIQPTSSEWVAATNSRYPHSIFPDPGDISSDNSYKSLMTGFVGWIADDNDFFRGVDILNSSYGEAAGPLTISRIDYFASTVPEPSTILLLCGGISALALIRNRPSQSRSSL